MQLLLSHELQIPGARCLSPAELRGHVEERFTWAVSRGQAVSALVCEPIGLERVERQNPGLTPRVLSALALALEPAFRASEAVVYLEPGYLVVLLVGLDLKRMEVACQEWVGGAKELRLDGLAGPLRISLRIGYGVTQPGKRLFLDTLIQVARAGLDVARCRGAGACVHTMVYDVLQERLERERGTNGIVVTASAPLGAGESVHEPGIEHTTHIASTRKSVLVDMERRERELTEALDTRRRENDQLERRLAKVLRTLEETEERLARVTLENAVDSGIASCYRTVQGLADDVPHRALKAVRMQQIFELNLELHERLRSRRTI